MKKMTDDDVNVVKHHLENAHHAIGHAFEAAALKHDIRCENEIDSAVEALRLAKGRLTPLEFPGIDSPEK